MSRILVINGSYRDDGITDQAVALALETLQDAGADSEVVNLREYPVEFCLNCRECTLQPGTAPGRCVLDDGMHDLIEKIEAAAYWPWDKPYPKFRKQGLPQKHALLISSSAAPSWLGRYAFGSVKQLKTTARTIGAKPVGVLFTGMANTEKHKRLPPKTMARTRALARRLLA